MLNTQYRMNETISSWSSKAMYHNKYAPPLPRALLVLASTLFPVH